MARGNHRKSISGAGRTTVSGGGMQLVSQSTVRNTNGVILRAGPGFDHSRTVKSKLSPRTIRGIEPPGLQPRNFPSPEV
jgi:hypothetical protein